MLPNFNKSYYLESKHYKGIGKFIGEGTLARYHNGKTRYIFQLAEGQYDLFHEDEIKKELESDEDTELESFFDHYANKHFNTYDEQAEYYRNLELRDIFDEK